MVLVRVMMLQMAVVTVRNDVGGSAVDAAIPNAVVAVAGGGGGGVSAAAAAVGRG